MAEVGKRNFAPQFVGLGGTGADVLASIIRNRDLIMPLIRHEGSRVSFLALDVANAQIDGLHSAYNDLLEYLKQRNIPSEKVSLTANSVKFPTPEAMFDFVRQYPDYLSKEGAGIPSNYKPWLSSAVEIPPLAGGVGRKRALAKAIYGLNYYLLRLSSDSINTFRQSVISSTLQPMIFIVYGLGGGSGSGMALDFTRHLRRAIGSGIPIIGFCVAPCPGDDPPAKGASAYASLVEHGAVLNRSACSLITKRFGKTYENPYNAFFMMSLGPAFAQGQGLIYAHQTIDEAIGDVLIRCLNFDPADLFASIGSNVDLGDKWLHTLTTVKISYPVQEYIDLSKRYLDKFDKIRILQKEKKEIYGGGGVNETGGVRHILEGCRSDLVAIYRKWLIRSGKYDPEKFDEAVNNLVHEDRSVESDFTVYLRGAHEYMKSQMEELYRSVRAVGLDAVEGTLEARVYKLLTEFYDLVQDLPKKYFIFETRAPEIMNSLQDDLATVQLPPRQVQILRDMMDLSDLIHDYCIALRAYLETRKLTDKLTRYLEASERSAAQERDLATISKIANPELVVLYSLLSSMFSPPGTELRNMDEYLTNCRRMRRLLSVEENDIEAVCNQIDDQRIAAQGEARRLEEDLSKLRPIISSPGRKKFLKSSLRDVEHRLAMVAQDMDDQTARLFAVRDKIKEYANIEKKYEVNSDYRRLIPEIIEMTNDYYERLSGMSRDKGFYDRTAELTENEQLQIMQRILKGDEVALSRESILHEILDMDHLKSYLVSVMGLFKSPDTMGLTNDYRTDFIWFTAVAPPGIWNKDLEQDLTTALSGYVEKDVARSIYIRQVESTDPWTIRFLLVTAKATPRYLSAYLDMKQLYEASSEGERNLAHSFLLEQGFRVEDSDPSKLALLLEVLDRSTENPEIKMDSRKNQGKTGRQD